MSKKVFHFIVAFIAFFTLASQLVSPVHAADKPTVTVTTSFLQDMVKQIAGDTVNVELIIPAGEDPHLFVAKAQDMQKIQKANLVLYHGLHFEGKMVEILEKSGVAVSKDFPKDKIGRMDEEGTEVVDPHFWFDTDLYKLAAQAAGQTLAEKFPEHKDEYLKNTENYLKQLDDLKTWIDTELAKIPKDGRYLITPHDAFNYFSREFGFTVVAPQGVSTDSEVSNEGIKTTVKFIIEHKVPAIFAESTTNPERMKKLQEAAKSEGFDVKVVTGEGQELFSDSLAPVGQPGDNYIDMYKHNIKLIVDNLAK